ncbi:Cys/Met metabolism PLP-dependent enzyme-domain-containing protein [Mycena crocata]|nr:Cys/Met metabolism PLP-dependent enzyme-domain-containing protein [Mycena crocata]
MMTYKFETIQLVAGYDVRQFFNRGLVSSIAMTIASGLGTFKQGRDVFMGKLVGHYYSRYDNPTVKILEERIIAAENGVAGVAAASGQGAQLVTLLALCDPGENIVACAKGLFGGTYGQFKLLTKIGINVKYADDFRPDSFFKQIDEKTRAIYVESISNPNLIVAPLRALAILAKAHGIPLIVDNTCGMGGYIIRPKDFGADIVVHSTSKWVCGHGNFLGGMLIDLGTFKWADSDKFKHKFVAAHGQSQFAVKARGIMATVATMQNAMGAWITLMGMNTLSLRAQRHCENALALATMLQNHPKVLWVSYPGLETHGQHELAVSTLSKNYNKETAFGGIVCFGLGDDERSESLIDNLTLANHASHMGDTKTLIIHVGSTQNVGLEPADKKKMGILPDLIRVSVGLEHIEDLEEDFKQALSHVKEQPAGSKEKVTTQVAA